MQSAPVQCLAVWLWNSSQQSIRTHFVRTPAVPYVNVMDSGLGYSLTPSSMI
jgi:hypothetical protein